MFGRRRKEFWDSLGHLATLAALIGGCFIVSWEAWPIVGRWHQQRLAKQFAAQIATTPDWEVKLPIRQLASLGAPAFAPLVEAAASERAAVAGIARQEIDLAFAAAQISLRETVDDETAEAMVALATALAENVERFGPAGKQWAERIALKMIDQVDRFPVATATSLLSQCSRLLDSVPPRGPRLQTVGTAVTSPQQENALGISPPNIDLQILAAPSEEALASVKRQQPFARPLESSLVEPQPEDVSNPPSRLSTEDLSRSWNGPSNPLRPPKLSGDASLSVEVLPGQAPPPPTTFVEVPTPLEMEHRLSKLRSLSNESLLARLPRSDKFVVGAIRAVLEERGMQAAELEMAVRVKSPDVAERMRLIDEVSAMPAASARRLLRLLLGDDSGEVRLRALTVLATTNDPGLAELARRIVIDDNDPRVAELASQLLRQ